MLDTGLDMAGAMNQCFEIGIQYITTTHERLSVQGGKYKGGKYKLEEATERQRS